MNRMELKNYIEEVYGVTPDCPWADSPDHEVYRHTTNRKWFGLIMPVKRSHFGLDGDGEIDVVNLKCDPVMIGSVRMNRGVYPAYHMNKANWISVALDGTADEEMIKMLLCMSYDLTAPRMRKKN